MTAILLTLIGIVNLFFIFYFVKDLAINKNKIMNEPANTIALPFASFFTFLLSTFGISDFAIGTVLYQKLNWVSLKKLPGTLNTQCVIPVAVMALSYITSIDVGIKTLAVCIISQVIGAYVGPRFVVKLPEKTIKQFIAIGLTVAAMLIIAGKLNLIPSNGTATELYGVKLVTASLLLFTFGALNNIGIGSYALTMATVYALGMAPAAAFPIMMGACTFSVPIGSMQFVKFGEYSRKITLSAATFGVLGVLTAVYFVKSLNTNMLQWLVITVLIYTAVSMFLELYKAKMQPKANPVN